MNKIAIFGVGGFGREVLTLVSHINTISPQYEIIGFFDDGYKRGTMINGFPVIGGIKEVNEFKDTIGLVIAVGNPNTKKTIINSITSEKISFPSLIHPSVIIGDKNFVKIGKGCIFCAGTIITTNIEIKDFVILNLLCTVGHDTIIGKYSSFMPSVNISGEVVIGESVYVGTGAKIINQLAIGDNSIIGAGAVVSKSIPADCTAVGVPAKPIKFHNE